MNVERNIRIRFCVSVNEPKLSNLTMRVRVSLNIQCPQDSQSCCGSEKTRGPESSSKEVNESRDTGLFQEFIGNSLITVGLVLIKLTVTEH